MYLIEDDKCIYNDNIICLNGDCNKCELNFKRKLKKIIKHTEAIQIRIEDILNEARKETQRKK